MKTCKMGTTLLIMILSTSLFLSLMGCGVAVTQQAAEHAVSDAQVAVSDARASSAQLYSTENMKRSERLLKEAENALSRDQKQRAYTLAMRAEDAARTAQQESLTYMRDTGVDIQEYKQDAAVPQISGAKPDTAVSVDPRFPSVAPQNPGMLTPPGKPVSSESLRYEMPPQQAPVFAPPGSVPYSSGISPMDSHFRNAALALEEAQNAVNSALLMIAKAQVEIGLSTSDAVVQQLSMSGVSLDMVNLVSSWYDYARRTAEAGNYTEAAQAIKRAQDYAQSLSPSVR